MSRPLMKKVFFFSAAGFAVGALAMALKNSFTSSSRGVEGSMTLASKNFASSLPHGKHLSVIQVALQAPHGIPENELDEVTLEGWVRLNQPVENDLKIRWDLPDGVVAVEGNIEETLTHVQAGQTMRINLTVKGFSKETFKLIALHGFIATGENQLGNSAVLTSRPEDSFEMLRNTASVESEKEEQQKSVLTGAIQR